ncbi:MAG: hypothetical protein ACREMQ_03370 [Longimicrobiales bacterium]
MPDQDDCESRLKRTIAGIMGGQVSRLEVHHTPEDGLSFVIEFDELYCVEIYAAPHSARVRFSERETVPFAAGGKSPENN